MSGLTERQSRFIDLYLEHGVAAKAARLAGYSQHLPTSWVQGFRLLRIAKVRDELARRKAEIERISGLDRQGCVRMLDKVYHNSLNGPRPSLRGAVLAVNSIARLLGYVGRKKGKR